MLERVICIIVGYFVGALVQTGYWYGKIKHIDIRDHGSGNAGTTNVMRTLGKKAGIITYIFDALKPILVVLVLHFVYGKNSDHEMLLFLYSGLGIVLGHNFPFYLKFKGGKGIAATSGVVATLALFPKYCFVFLIAGIITFALVTKLSRYVSLGSLVGIFMFFAELCLWAVLGWLPMAPKYCIEGCIVVFVIVIFGFVQHRGNIERLIHGTERKIGEKRK